MKITVTDNVRPDARKKIVMRNNTIALLFSAATLMLLACAPATAQQTTGVPGSPGATTTIDGNYLPSPPPKFGGRIGLDAAQSKPYWPPAVVPPKGAPNVLLIMTDDAGYGVSGTFGGVIPTPALDRIAQMGLRYTQFHSTALCSPTRAALITGRNHHSVGFGVITEQSTGYPGYDSIIGPENATIGAILKQNGATSWFGKEHNTPSFQYSLAGPFDQWPVGMGFEYFYGFMGGETDQWTPFLFRNQAQIFPWIGKPGYNLTTDIADEAIKYMNELNAAAPDKPFFLYYVPGGTHAPHQPTQEWIDKFKGKFDMGWNELRDQIIANQKRLGVIPSNTTLPPWPDGQAEYGGASLPEWETLSADEKKLFARQAEVYAAYVAYTDHEIGRVIQAVQDIGKLDNTLNRIKDAGGIRTQFHHMIDIVPTILEATGIPAPIMVNGIAQKPIEGVSMTYTFDKASANVPSARTTQYFEMFGNRAIYHDGWIAATTPPAPPWLLGLTKMPDVINGYKWELYNIAEDYSEYNDLAAKMPGKLREMQELFLVEASKYNVFPLDNSIAQRFVAPRPSATAGRNMFTYSGEMSGLPDSAAPDLLNRSYTITAEVEVPPGGGEGMIVTEGGRFGGYGLYLLKGKPVFLYNMLGLERFRWEGQQALSPGAHTIVFEFTYDGPGFAKGGSGVLKIDNKEVEGSAYDTVCHDHRRDLRCRRRHPNAGRRRGLSGAFPLHGQGRQADLQARAGAPDQR
jgi:arylsulfatase A-like enzyme